MLHPVIKRSKFVTMVLLIVLLAFSAVLPVFADSVNGGDQKNQEGTAEDTMQIFKPTALPNVPIKNQSYIKLNEALMIPAQGGNTVTYQMSLVNNGNTEISFIDYWARLRSSDGTNYTLNLLDEGSGGDLKVAPKSSLDFTFYAKVGANIKLQDLILNVVEFDFSYPDYQKTLGTIKLPADYSTVTPVNMIKPMMITGIQVNTSLVDYVSNLNGGYYSNYLKIELENVGNKKVTMPDYHYYLVTSGGIMYELDLSDTGVSEIQARDSKSFSLTTETPASVDIIQSQFVITAMSNGLEIPVATFQLPEAKTETPQEGGSSIGQEFVFSSSSGNYGIVLNSIQRLPWGDQDIIAADLTLSNKGSASVPIPSFQGVFELDGVALKDVDIRFVSLDQIYGLRQNAKTNIMLYIKVPYTFEYDQLKLVLQAVDPNTSAVRDLVEFDYENKNLEMPTIRTGKHTFHDIGRRAVIEIRNVHTYEKENSDLFYIELEMENAEKRPTVMTRINGLLKTKDDIYFPAKVSVVADQMMPSDKALLTLTSELPKGYTMEDLQIVIGQGLQGSTLAVGNGEMEAFMKAVAMNLPPERVSVQSDFRDLEFMPYQLTIRNLRTTLVGVAGDSKPQISFHYDLTEDSPYFVNPEGHSVVMEFVAEDITHSQELVIGEDLLLGSHKTELVVDVHSILTRITGLNQYTINIYDQYEGHKKLIASKKMNWYVTYD